MITLMKRILSVSGPYQGRIKLAFIFAFLKAMLSKAPIWMCWSWPAEQVSCLSRCHHVSGVGRQPTFHLK